MINDEFLIKLSQHIYYIKYPTNIGIIENPIKKELYLIETANDEESIKIIFDFLNKKFPNYKIKVAINTHSHADHCGGNDYLTKTTNCEIWTSKLESAMMEYPLIETNLIWGGTPIHDLKTKYFVAKSCKADKILEEGKTEIINLNENSFIKIEPISLKGHYIDQIGILITDTDEKISFFLGDAISGRNVIRKYWIQYLLDEQQTKDSLMKISSIKADFYVPAHGNLVTDIEGLVELNLIALLETENLILHILKTPKTTEQILKEVADVNGIKLRIAQYVLIGSTLHSYLTSLYEQEKITFNIEENIMKWQRIDN